MGSLGPDGGAHSTVSSSNSLAFARRNGLMIPSAEPAGIPTAPKNFPTIYPSGPNVTIYESSFFKQHPSLPSLEAVRSQASLKSGPKAKIAVFERLNLLVKFGLEESIAEGQCLYTIRRVFGTTIPVPEVYAWYVDNQESFIFMEFVHGISLEKRWGQLSAEGRQKVCEELHEFLNKLRGATQDPQNQFIGIVILILDFPDSADISLSGHISRTPLLDIAFPVDALPTAGPFPTVKAFNDWFSRLYRRNLINPDSYQQDPYRGNLPDTCKIKFTHGDLHRSNIIVAQTGLPYIVALIDWHQAGWLPEYWEACKAMYTAEPDDEWVVDYIPQFLEKRMDIMEAWDFYISATGN